MIKIIFGIIFMVGLGITIYGILTAPEGEE